MYYDFMLSNNKYDLIPRLMKKYCSYSLNNITVMTLFQVGITLANANKNQPQYGFILRLNK